MPSTATNLAELCRIADTIATEHSNAAIMQNRFTEARQLKTAGKLITVQQHLQDAKAKLLEIITEVRYDLENDKDWDPSDVAHETEDAYSADSYSSWTEVARILKRRGFNRAQAVAIMRSKFMRWARDCFHNGNGQAPASCIAKYLDKYGYTPEHEEVKKLTAETFDLV